MDGMTVYSDSGVSPRTEVYAERQMLKHAAPVKVLDLFGMVREMPKNKGETIKFRRPRPFTANTVPLQEGVTPTATKFSYEDVPATLKQYGMLVEITDKIQDLAEDPVLRDASKQCGENVGRTVEALSYGVLRAGTNVFFANGIIRTSVNTPIGLNGIQAVSQALNAQKGMPITQILVGATTYATQPIEGGFMAVTHTDVASDIRKIPGFVPTAKYGSRQKIHQRELGAVEDMRFILSPDLGSFADAGGTYAGSGTNMKSTSGTSADVYPVLIFAEDAYGCVPLRGEGAIEPVIVPVEKRDKSDPLGQRGYVGWKMWFVCVILNQAWMARLEVAVTDLTDNS